MLKALVNLLKKKEELILRMKHKIRKPNTASKRYWYILNHL